MRYSWFRKAGHDSAADAVATAATCGAGDKCDTATNEAKDFLLREGTDIKYGARPLKRSIERLLVHPMSNLIATNQLEAGDRVWVECDGERLVFSKQAEGLASAAA